MRVAWWRCAPTFQHGRSSRCEARDEEFPSPGEVWFAVLGCAFISPADVEEVAAATVMCRRRGSGWRW